MENTPLYIKLEEREGTQKYYLISNVLFPAIITAPFAMLIAMENLNFPWLISQHSFIRRKCIIFR